jgi:hypothetical protein
MKGLKLCHQGTRGRGPAAERPRGPRAPALPPRPLALLRPEAAPPRPPPPGTGCFFPNFKEVQEGHVRRRGAPCAGCFGWSRLLRAARGRGCKGSAQLGAPSPGTAAPLHAPRGPPVVAGPLHPTLPPPPQGEHIPAIEERTEETRMFRSFAGGYRK